MIAFIVYYTIAAGQCRTEVYQDLPQTATLKLRDRAAVVCREKYKASPCLVKFEQVGANDFTAICGRVHE